ncbi:hypothetical protein DERP_001523 [Dermatophagoides pteronyssinus]|uniref:Uncharacterized protein n=1 Tax=Dermatophagoides pteronyssinus TaxID=6956 RepID=A0ABQ8JEN9_DERPT|nr:hypothetical protein DERP_001523 [Dermatophagoides pteronyssinus]
MENSWTLEFNTLTFFKVTRRLNQLQGQSIYLNHSSIFHMLFVRRFFTKFAYQMVLLYVFRSP